MDTFLTTTTFPITTSNVQADFYYRLPTYSPARDRAKTQAERTRSLIQELTDDLDLNAGIQAMLPRASEFSSRLACQLAGIAVMPESRVAFEESLDMMWAEEPKIGSGAAAPKEIVVGGGLHAAIYCAVRVASGYPRPLVLEAGKVGGVFNTSRRPSFYLNSRNRPGRLSIPGRNDGALNVLPSGAVQPSDLSSDEYQRNADLAFAIRATLAMNARVFSGQRVTQVGSIGPQPFVVVDGELPRRTYGNTIYAERVILALGLGRPNRIKEENQSDRILSYADFLAKMDDTFPLRDVRSVAVIGAGDSGKTAIEALTGQGPEMGWSVMGIDYPERIDWYGVPSDQLTRGAWEACNRSRYKGIGRLLIDGTDPGRVNALSERCEYLTAGYDSAYVNEKPYDLVVDCTGFKPSELGSNLELEIAKRGGRRVARKAKGAEIYAVGPMAQLGISDAENAVPAISRIGENSTSLFRYAGRTASLAAGADDLDLDEADRRERVMTGLSDTNGKEIYVGDTVGYGGTSSGVVLGAASNVGYSAYIVVDNGSGTAFTATDGRKGFGIKAVDTTVSKEGKPEPRVSTGKVDKNGKELFVGDRVLQQGKIQKVVGNNRKTGVNILTDRVGGTGRTKDGTPGFKVSPGSLVLAPSTNLRDSTGREIYVGERVRCADAGPDTYRVIGVNDGRGYTGNLLLIDRPNGGYYTAADVKGFGVTPTDTTVVDGE